jgi:hypothetical protein
MKRVTATVRRIRLVSASMGLVLFAINEPRRLDCELFGRSVRRQQRRVYLFNSPKFGGRSLRCEGGVPVRQMPVESIRQCRAALFAGFAER